MKINSKKLNEIMENRNINGKMLSDQSGVQTSTISVMRSGKGGCSFESLVKIAAALNVDFFELVSPEVRCYR